MPPLLPQAYRMIHEKADKIIESKNKMKSDSKINYTRSIQAEFKTCGKVKDLY